MTDCPPTRHASVGSDGDAGGRTGNVDQPVEAGEYPASLPGEIVHFIQAVENALRRALGGELTGTYLTGSLALGDYLAAASDIDMIAIVGEPLGETRKRLVAGAAARLAAACPARGLELVVYARTRFDAFRRLSIGEPDGGGPGIPFEVNLNAGPRMPYSLSFSPERFPGHWFVLDVSIARERAVTLTGPVAETVFPPVPRPIELRAQDEALAWYARNLPAHPSSVLTGCRAWHRAEAGEWVAKRTAAAWASGRARSRAALITDAVHAYETGTTMPSQAEVVDFLWEIRGQLQLAGGA